MSKKCFAVQKYDFRRKFAVQMKIFRRIILKP